MKERYFSITFPDELVREPVLYSLVRRYDLTPYVYKASVTNSSGWLVVQLAGDDGKIDQAVLDLRCRGALVHEGGAELVDVPEPAALRTVRVRLAITAEKAREPFYSKIIKDHDVTINIRQASIGAERGVVDLEICGALESIDGAIETLKKDGIGVGPIEGNVIE